MLRSRWLQPKPFLILYFLVAGLSSVLLVTLRAPHELIILLLAPVFFAALYCPRRVYLTMLLLLLALALPVTYYSGSNMHGSLETISVMLVTTIASTEIIHHVSRARDHAVAAREASEARLRRVFERSAIGLALCDAAGTLIDANTACLRAFGQPDVAALRASGLLAQVQPTEEERTRLAAGDTVHHSLVLSLATEMQSPGEFSSAHHLDLFITPFDDNTAGSPPYLIQVQDVTERHHLEQQLRQAQKMEAIGRLAGGMAHEFNNLLTVINGYTEFVLEALPAADDMCRDVQQIRKAGERAADLTRRLLAFSRRQPQQLTVLNLNEVVDNTARMLQRLIDDNITLELQLASDVGQIRADVTQVEQMLLNLVTNACDAMPHGGQLILATSNVELQAGESVAVGEAVPGRYVALSVSDTGTGISPEVHAHLFEPFFTTKEPGKGTGLGLATIYGIMQQNGGAIQVESQMGQGSTFRLLFPFVDEKADAQPENLGTQPLQRKENLLSAEESLEG